MTKRMKPSFEAAFPNITRWVKDCGTVEIGYDPHTDSFIRAIQEGGLVWSGESQYKSLDDAFQESISWGMVRNIKSWDLLIVEQALRSIIRTDEAPYWLYQAARDHVGSSDFLTAKFIPRIEGIARFWRRYFKVKA